MIFFKPSWTTIIGLENKMILKLVTNVHMSTSPDLAILLLLLLFIFIFCYWLNTFDYWLAN